MRTDVKNTMMVMMIMLGIMKVKLVMMAPGLILMVFIYEQEVSNRHSGVDKLMLGGNHINEKLLQTFQHSSGQKAAKPG